MLNQELENENVIYVFIDASNLWEALKAKGKFLNFEKAIKHIKEKFRGTIDVLDIEDIRGRELKHRAELEKGRK